MLSYIFKLPLNGDLFIRNISNTRGTNNTCSTLSQQSDPTHTYSTGQVLALDSRLARVHRLLGADILAVATLDGAVRPPNCGSL